jgi:hypothetical protein
MAALSNKHGADNCENDMQVRSFIKEKSKKNSEEFHCKEINSISFEVRQPKLQLKKTSLGSDEEEKVKLNTGSSVQMPSDRHHSKMVASSSGGFHPYDRNKL